MAQIPPCPNVKEGKCEKSDTVYGGETRDGGADIIICKTCSLLWMISKPKTSQRAAYERSIERMQRATEREKQRATKRLLFDMGRNN